MAGGIFEIARKEDAKEFLDRELITRKFMCYGDKNPQGCDSLGDFYAQFEGDMQTALKIWKENCDQHSFGRSCERYGENLLKGRGGLKRDRETALGYLDKACKANSPRGCFHQGAVYQLGTKFRQPDPEKALGYYEKACNLGMEVSCLQLHQMYFYPNFSVKQNCEKAIKYAEMACDKHMMQACLSLTRMYELGECTKVDIKKAMEFRKKYDTILYDVTHPGPQLTG